MLENTPHKISLIIASWLQKNWWKAISVAFSFICTVAVASFFIGKYYADLSFQFEKIKIAQDYTEKLNQEIDKNRALHDQITQQKIDDLKEATNQIQKRLK